MDAASDGREGLVKARSWTYDAIVLDLMLPQMNGFEVLRELRKHFTTPVLILTAAIRCKIAWSGSIRAPMTIS